MSETKIYLELSGEVQKIITQSGISVATILQREEIDAEITYGASPLQSGKKEQMTRDLATIIAVSAISAVPVAIAINKFIKSFKKETVIAKYYKYEPVTDPKTGEILKDKKGDPLINKIPQFEVGKKSPKHVKEEFQLDGPLHLSISFKSETKELEDIEESE